VNYVFIVLLGSDRMCLYILFGVLVMLIWLFSDFDIFFMLLILGRIGMVSIVCLCWLWVCWMLCVSSRLNVWFVLFSLMLECMVIEL